MKTIPAEWLLKLLEIESTVSEMESVLVGFRTEISLARAGLSLPPLKMEILPFRRSSVLALSSSTALMRWLCWLTIWTTFSRKEWRLSLLKSRLTKSPA